MELIGRVCSSSALAIRRLNSSDAVRRTVARYSGEIALEVSNHVTVVRANRPVQNVIKRVLGLLNIHAGGRFVGA